MSAIRMKILGQMGFSTASKIYLTLINFVVNVQLARIFTPDDLGRFFLIFSVVVAAGTVGQLGLRVAAVRLLSKASVTAPKSIPVLVSIIMAGGLLGGVGVSVVVFAASSLLDTAFHTQVFQSLAPYVCLWALLATINTLCAEINRGLLQIKVAILSNGLISSTLVLVGLIGSDLIAMKLTLANLLTIFGCAAVVSIFASLASILYHKHINHLWSHAVFGGDGAFRLPILEIYSLAKLTLMTSILLVIINQASTWIVGAVLSMQDVGYFGLLMRFFGFIAMPLVVLRAFLPVNISALYSQGKYQKILRLNRLAIYGLFGYGLCAIIVWWFAGKAFILMFFGPLYLPLDALMMWLVCAMTVRFLFGIAPSVMEVCDQNKQYLKITFNSGIVGVILMIYLTSEYAMEGAVIGHMVLITLPAALSFVAIQKHFRDRLQGNMNEY